MRLGGESKESGALSSPSLRPEMSRFVLGRSVEGVVRAEALFAGVEDIAWTCTEIWVARHWLIRITCTPSMFFLCFFCASALVFLVLYSWCVLWSS
jgi:hypothetical protein